jgi:hypothetical protein
LLLTVHLDGIEWMTNEGLRDTGKEPSPETDHWIDVRHDEELDLLEGLRDVFYDQFAFMPLRTDFIQFCLFLQILREEGLGGGDTHTNVGLVGVGTLLDKVKIGEDDVDHAPLGWTELHGEGLVEQLLAAFREMWCDLTTDLLSLFLRGPSKSRLVAQSLQGVDF